MPWNPIAAIRERNAEKREYEELKRKIQREKYQKAWEAQQAAKKREEINSRIQAVIESGANMIVSDITVDRAVPMIYELGYSREPSLMFFMEEKLPSGKVIDDGIYFASLTQVNGYAVRYLDDEFNLAVPF